MANTVNDVMNVIANPDYGIRNIAGTNQEILAIIQGTHNSKNNIYNIVDDVRNLLQELVDVDTKKKTVQISGNNSTKINHRHIQDILDETKGIRKAIDNLAKSIGKQWKTMPAVAKLSDKASEKVANAMVKSMNKQNVGRGLSSFIDTISKLKNISLKDIFVGKIKLNRITKIFNKAKENLKDIKGKDLKSIIKLIKFAPEMVDSLSSIGFGVNRIIRKNIIEKFSDILVGKNSILSISTLLKKHKKEFIAAKETAKNITALIGNLFTSTILLTKISITGKLALLGVNNLEKIIKKISQVIKELSDDKHTKKATKVAFKLMTFTGHMAATSMYLAAIAVTGIPALIGSLLLEKIINLNVGLFKKLKLSKTNIAKGSIAMVIMSSSLILFGIALKKIFDATKGVEWKQFGMIAATTGLFALAIAAFGTPVVAPFIFGGSIVMSVMGLSLMSFAKAISKTSKVAKNIQMKQIYKVLNVIKLISNFFKENALNKKDIKMARRYKKILIPFGTSIEYLAKLKELGVLPMKLVYQTLNAMKSIANYYIENPIRKKAIRQADRYKDMLKPFGKTIKHLSKLKELGVLPMKLVYQTLNVMKSIANYYIENPIRKKAIKQAKRYKDILKPFGKTIKHLSKLKELGVLPMKLVYQTLNTISAIANYYIENPIRKKTIRQAKRYKDILKHFGKTIQHISKLKELGDIPINTVNKAVIAMKTITEFLKQDSLNGIQRRRAIKNMSMLNDITSLMTNIFNINNSNISSIGDAMSNALGGVNTVDISKVKAVTNMFNAFNEINKSENVINKFTESVKDFTESCKNLMNAMSDNTDAINNIDGVGLNGSNVREIRENNIIEKSHNGDVTQNDGIIIANVDEIAKTIAEKINGALYVDIPDTQVQLLINGMGGNEWTISRY